MIEFKGSFRRADLAPRGVRSNNYPPSLQMIRRTRGRDDSFPTQTVGGNDIVSIAMRVLKKTVLFFYFTHIFTQCLKLLYISITFQILVAMGHIIKQPAIHSLMVASKSEYKTRHLIDGRIVQCDQRISLVSGYMADEVYNLSPFTFMHRDDVRWVMVALRQSK